MDSRCCLGSARGQQKPDFFAKDYTQFHTILTGLMLPKSSGHKQLCYAVLLRQGVCF